MEEKDKRLVDLSQPMLDENFKPFNSYERYLIWREDSNHKDGGFYVKDSKTGLELEVYKKTPEKSLTLRDVICRNLINGVKGMSEDQKSDDYFLWKDIKMEKENKIKISEKDKTHIKDYVKKNEPTIICGQVNEMLK